MATSSEKIQVQIKTNSSIGQTRLRTNTSSTVTSGNISIARSKSDLVGTSKIIEVKNVAARKEKLTKCKTDINQNIAVRNHHRSKSSPLITLHAKPSPTSIPKINTISLDSIKTNPIRFISPGTSRYPQIILTRATLGHKTESNSTPSTSGIKPVLYTPYLNKTRTSTRIIKLNSRTNPETIVDEPVPSSSGLNKPITSTRKESLNIKTNPKIIVDEPIPNTSDLNKTVKLKKTSTKTINSTNKLIRDEPGSKTTNISTKTKEKSKEKIINNMFTIINPVKPKSAANSTTSKFVANPSHSKSAANLRTSKFAAYPDISKTVANPSTLKSSASLRTSKFAAYPANSSTSKSASNSSTSKTAAKPSSSKTAAKPSTSKTAAYPSTSKFAAYPSRSKFVAKPSTSKLAANPAVPHFASHTITSKLKSQSPIRNVLHIVNKYDEYFNGPITSSSKLEKNIEKEPVRKLTFNDKVIQSKKKPAASVIQSKKKPAASIIPKKEETPNVHENFNIMGDQPSTSNASENQHYYRILQIFPDICPVYLKTFCAENSAKATIDELISVLLNDDYRKHNRPELPESNLVFEEQYTILQDLFPDADPTYLQHHCERLIDQPDAFGQFVTSLVESKTYPTKEEYLKKMKLSAQEKQYTTEFDVKQFLKLIPNPQEFFNDPKRKISHDTFDDTTYAVTFLKNRYCTIAVKDITQIFRNSGLSVLLSADALESFQYQMKTKRKPYPVTSCQNIPLLQEIAYVEHRTEIELYLKEQKLENQLIREEAKKSGLMKTCQCCYDDEVLPDEVISCDAGSHIFCKECVRKACEVVIGDGKLDFPCLETCNNKFSLQVLQVVLTPKVFSKMAQRKQMEEVKSAGIEDLEFCPFCDFAVIPAPSDKLFRCLNDDCMKESCRSCKEPSHIPLKCNEIEKDKDVEMRTYIENKMTEALLRTCYKCGLKFIKEIGCNKMTCSCGAKMCYVCSEPVKNYKHFKEHDDQTHLCPLYSNIHKLHVDAIKKGAENAKKELGVGEENALKMDPSADIVEHYRNLAAQNPAVPDV